LYDEKDFNLYLAMFKYVKVVALPDLA
jgi:hypothetical protein